MRCVVVCAWLCVLCARLCVCVCCVHGCVRVCVCVRARAPKVTVSFEPALATWKPGDVVPAQARVVALRPIEPFSELRFSCVRPSVGSHHRGDF